MKRPRFLQIHTLTSYAGALLNRDDSGLAKRLPYGDVLRTRISSQCLKRHWRIADDPHALGRIDGATAAFRSRELVTHKVLDPLRSSFADAIVDAIAGEFQVAVYGKKGTTRQGRQSLLLGQPELEWLAGQAEQVARKADGDATKAAEAARAWGKEFQANIKSMRESSAMPAGLTSALFGRMVTSDMAANITAPVHVAHAFTVHEEEPESDYLTAVDDLAKDAPGADTIQETELTSGLFYGYVVVDLNCLHGNLGGDMELAGQVLHNLVYLIAEVSPGAKLGSTAPYGRASLMLLEAGDRQPRSLSEAYRKACKPHVVAAADALAFQLGALDEVYATGEERRYLSVSGEVDIPRAERGSLAELTAWARSLSARAAV
ncbi:MAG: type I-E CRISPR-associated protein Cas7/Cse4/CasC [Boseongicola sp.]|nr:type I-E CRISPR-associated protein Cas7/Cse4/CasC [Boseongicola sp.]